MDELAKLIDNAAITPAYTKKAPKTAPFQKRDESIKATALAIIADTLKDKKETATKILQKVDKGTVSITAIWEAIQQFESAVGGRQALITALQHCPVTSQGYGLINKLLEDPDFLEFARVNDQEDNVRYSLAVICNRHKIPFPALVTAFKDAKTAEISIQSLTQMAAETPRIVEQLTQDAQNTYHPCHLCEGIGRIWKIGSEGEWLLDENGDHMTQICHNCRGQGKIFKEHDVQNRKMLLQMVGVLEDKKGPLVGITYNQNANVFKGDFLPGDGSFEKLLKAVDAQEVQTIEATVIESVPNAVYEDINEAK